MSAAVRSRPHNVTDRSKIVYRACILSYRNKSTCFDPLLASVVPHEFYTVAAEYTTNTFGRRRQQGHRLLVIKKKHPTLVIRYILFIHYFSRCIDGAEEHADLETRLANLVSYSTTVIYRHVTYAPYAANEHQKTFEQ